MQLFPRTNSRKRHGPSVPLNRILTKPCCTDFYYDCFFLVPKTVLLEEFLYIPNYQKITLNLILSSWINSWEKKHAYCFVIQYIVQKLLSTDFKLQVQMFCSLMQAKIVSWIAIFDLIFFCKPDCPRFYETYFIRPIFHPVEF